MLTDASLTADVSLRSSNSSSLAGTTYREEGEPQCVVDLCDSKTQDAPGGAGVRGGSTLVSSHLRVFATEVAVHGGAGGHLSPTEVTRLGLHLLVSQMDVLLQHVLGQVLLITRCACPRLPHCGEKMGSSALKHLRYRSVCKFFSPRYFCHTAGNYIRFDPKPVKDSVKGLAWKCFDCDVRVSPV